MTLEAMIANYEDLRRLRKLEAQGHFKPGFANGARDRVLRYVARIGALATVFTFIPYCGPTVTSSVAQASACGRSDPMDVQVQLLTGDEQAVIDTVTVPGSKSGIPLLYVIVYEDEYFIGPHLAPHAAMFDYRRVRGCTIEKAQAKACATEEQK